MEYFYHVRLSFILFYPLFFCQLSHSMPPHLKILIESQPQLIINNRQKNGNHCYSYSLCISNWKYQLTYKEGTWHHILITASFKHTLLTSVLGSQVITPFSSYCFTNCLEHTTTKKSIWDSIPSICHMARVLSHNPIGGSYQWANWFKLWYPYALDGIKCTICFIYTFYNRLKVSSAFSKDLTLLYKYEDQGMCTLLSPMNLVKSGDHPIPLLYIFWFLCPQLMTGHSSKTF
jgi:hypothetical protein